MKTWKNVTFVAIVAVLGLAFAGCNNEPKEPKAEPKKVSITNVILSESKITLLEGQSVTLVATVEPEKAANKNVLWASDKESVATVDQKGKLEAVAAGTAIITATAKDGGKKASCIVTVKPVPISIAVTKAPTKTLYKIGEQLDLKDIVVTATYSDDSTDDDIEITLNHISNFAPNTVGPQTVTVTYGEFSDTFDVTVLALSKIDVSLIEGLERILVAFGEEIDLEDIVVTATYKNEDDDNPANIITEEVTITLDNISDFNSDTIGKQTVTVTYGYNDCTDTFEVLVLGLVKIEITEQPNKKRYITGEGLDLDGLEITATFSDDETEVIHHDRLHISGFNTNSISEQTITVTYGDHSDTFKVTVVALSKIEVTEQPTKTRYALGEQLDTGGIEVTATFTDNKTEDISAHIRVTGFRPNTLGQQTLTVTYNGKTTTFKVTVFFTVTFNPNGGNWNNDTGNKIVELDEKIIGKPDDPTRDGYVFGGWYTDNNTFNNAWSFGIHDITSDVNLYAKWLVTVTFNTNGGSTIAGQNVKEGGKVTRPTNPSKSDLAFAGWYTEEGFVNAYDFNSPVTQHITLYAQWLTVDDSDFGPGASITQIFNVANTTQWDDARTAIQNGGNDKNYIINVTANFTVTGTYDSFGNNVSNVKVAIRGADRTLSSSGGPILSVRANQTVILRDITLQGRRNGVNGANSDNSSALVTVFANGTLEMKGNAGITGNTHHLGAYGGGGVYVNNGTLTMWDNASVSDNVTNSNGGSTGGGGGVYLDGGAFTMNGGRIYGNTSSASSTGFGGGGVYMAGGTFTMNDGRIYSNTRGGGVYVAGGTFTMNGGEISGPSSVGSDCGVRGNVTMYGGKITNNNGGGVIGDVIMYGGEITNNSSYFGGGVAGSVTMYGGEITGNTATQDGGGVYCTKMNGGVVMLGGKISGNKASSSSGWGDGGGVYATTVVMWDGEISDNTATQNGGGVYAGGFFFMNGGEISGNKNTNGNGGGVYFRQGAEVENMEAFTMNGGKISGNKANGTNNTNGSGGGVYVSGGGFNSYIMNDGEISGNSATNDGGGMYMYYCRYFTMNGGKISGNTANNRGGGLRTVSTNGEISNGIIYGSGEAVSIRNTASEGSAYAFSGDSGGLLLRNGFLRTTDDTIWVVDRELQ